MVRDQSLLTGSPTLPQRSSLGVVALRSLSNPALRESRKRQRSYDDMPLAERVKKLVHQTKVLLEDLEDLDPAADE